VTGYTGNLTSDLRDGSPPLIEKINDRVVIHARPEPPALSLALRTLSKQESTHHVPQACSVSRPKALIICAPAAIAESWGMQIRLIKHEAVPKCGSFEARFPDVRPSRYFCWDDIPGRRLRPDLVDGATAEEPSPALNRTSWVLKISKLFVSKFELASDCMHYPRHEENRRSMSRLFGRLPPYRIEIERRRTWCLPVFGLQSDSKTFDGTNEVAYRLTVPPTQSRVKGPPAAA
jgi:hypothetical protein